MLYKPQVVTVTPGTPGQAGREASYECTAYESGGQADDGGGTTPPDSSGGSGGGGGSGIRFGGFGTPYAASNGEIVYTDPEGDGYWNEEQIADASKYACVWGTSEPVTVNGSTIFITAPFCTYTG